MTAFQLLAELTKESSWRRRLLQGIPTRILSDAEGVYMKMQTGSAPATVRRLSDFANTLGLDVAQHDQFVPGRAFSAFRAAVPAPLRGIGVGRKMYGDAIRAQFESYRTTGVPRFFTSSHTGNTSDDAIRLWKSLQRRGYPVMEGGPSQAKFSIDMADMHKFYKDRK